MAVLTNPQGVFKGCSIGKGHDGDRDRNILNVPPPPGLFAAED
ncbi:MAG: hypothetical protein M3Q98_02090 [Actinomycetota bacterium]|nr:hypothetical protein [Actinomycetota bacterium]